MGSVNYSIRQNGRIKTIEGIRLNPYLAAKYIENKGWLVDHLPSMCLASPAYFASLEVCAFFAEIYVTALGTHVTKTSMFMVVPAELKLFRSFLDMLKERCEWKGDPLTIEDIKNVTFELEKRIKS